MEDESWCEVSPAVASQRGIAGTSLGSFPLPRGVSRVGKIGIDQTSPG